MNLVLVFFLRLEMATFKCFSMKCSQGIFGANMTLNRHIFEYFPKIQKFNIFRC